MRDRHIAAKNIRNENYVKYLLIKQREWHRLVIEGGGNSANSTKRQALGDQEHAKSKSSLSQLEHRKDIDMKKKSGLKAGPDVWN